MLHIGPSDMNMLFPSEGRTPSRSPCWVVRPARSGSYPELPGCVAREPVDGIGTTVIDSAALAPAGLLSQPVVTFSRTVPGP